MKIHDISVNLSQQMPIWPGDPKIYLERISKIEEGAAVNLTRLDMGVHTGTHIDAPYHFFANGAKVDALPLDLLVGPAQVISLPQGIKKIDAETVEKVKIPADCRRLLFKTANSDLWARGDDQFRPDYVALTRDGAEALIQRGLKVIGIDYLSVASYDQLTPTHLVLLGAGVIVIEGLDLSKVDDGQYTLVCLPLKLEGTEGAPARAILIEE